MAYEASAHTPPSASLNESSPTSKSETRKARDTSMRDFWRSWTSWCVILLQDRQRPGRLAVATPYPYAVTYRIDGEDVVVLGFRHTSRRPN